MGARGKGGEQEGEGRGEKEKENKERGIEEKNTVEQRIKTQEREGTSR